MSRNVAETLRAAKRSASNQPQNTARYIANTHAAVNVLAARERERTGEDPVLPSNIQDRINHQIAQVEASSLSPEQKHTAKSFVIVHGLHDYYTGGHSMAVQPDEAGAVLQQHRADPEMQAEAQQLGEAFDVVNPNWRDDPQAQAGIKASGGDVYRAFDAVALSQRAQDMSDAALDAVCAVHYPATQDPTLEEAVASMPDDDDADNAQS